jgi:hypothetical protein
MTKLDTYSHWNAAVNSAAAAACRATIVFARTPGNQFVLAERCVR